MKSQSRSLVGGVVFTIDCSTPTGVEWCSPGFWKNVDVNVWWASPETPFTVTGQTPYTKVKGQQEADPTATLYDVITQPQKYGGSATEATASYLSGEAGLHGSVPTAEQTYSCPLSGDGNKKK